MEGGYEGGRSVEVQGRVGVERGRGGEGMDGEGERVRRSCEHLLAKDGGAGDDAWA